jgi:periplasmic divalent cation tolerance protein
VKKLCMVYITASDKDEAMEIGEKLVSLRLAACANVFDNITSCYWWEGEKRKDQEAVIILKTKESLLPELERTVKGLHSYSCPCILALPAVYVNEDYAEWIARETKEA